MEAKVLGRLLEKNNKNELKETKLLVWVVPKQIFENYTFPDVYQSPLFSFVNMSWHIQLGAFESFSQDDFLKVRLRNPAGTDVKMSLIFAIGKPNPNNSVETIVEETPYKYDSAYPFLSRNLVDIHGRGYLDGDNTLGIICILKFVSPGSVQGLKRKLVHTPEHMNLAGLESLSKNFKGLFGNKDDCDVTLIVQGTAFKAHKYILTARSPVFAAMFRHDTTERRTGQVTIADCDPNYFQEFLEYLYCGRLEAISSDNAFHLYKTADKYDVQELKALCVNYLMQNLTVETIYDVFIIADEYDEANLFTLAQQFFIENTENILKTSQWENLFRNKFSLVTRLLIEMVKTKK